MKRTVCLFLADNNLWLALVALLALAMAPSVANAAASTRPRTGGTLRVQMGERVATIDPRLWPSATAQSLAAERLDSLVFDRLVRLDDHGALRPALAISWQHDALCKRWEFRLRGDVKFSDGSPLTPPVVAMALQQLLASSFDVTAASDSVVIQSEYPSPDLDAELATGRYFIFHLADDHSLAGTGPFRLAEWPEATSHGTATFVANETCWAGRPFVDRVELAMGVSSEQRSNAISFGQVDVVELAAPEVRRATQRGSRTTSSEPIELLALVFDLSRSAVRDARVRRAISLSIDRNSIADVILQKQGVPAGGLLPNWISGYAYLFPAVSNLAEAKNLLALSGHEPSRSVALVLACDSGDAESRAVADRVAVNLREAGIMVQVVGQMAEGKSKNRVTDMRLVRERILAPESGLALAGLLRALGESSLESAPDLETPEQIYAAERAPIDAFRVIPLVHVSETYGLGPKVRDWLAPRWGGWRLDEVWIGEESGPGGNSP